MVFQQVIIHPGDIVHLTANLHPMEPLYSGPPHLDFDHPMVMGILNATPDSFHSGSRVNRDNAMAMAADMIQQGADMLDLGGQSSRPGATKIGPDQEWERIAPILQGLVDRWPRMTVSVDTFHAKVAEKAIRAGARMVNDISAGTLDPDLPHVVAKHGVPFVMMHMQGTPKTMQVAPHYQDVVSEVCAHLSERVGYMRSLGIEQLILDPGFGFGKRIEDNYALLSRLLELQGLGCPLLIGLSRKSMIYKALNLTPEEALNGSTALHAWALERGASILRVHDVAPAVECVRLHQYLRGSQLGS